MTKGIFSKYNIGQPSGTGNGKKLKCFYKGKNRNISSIRLTPKFSTPTYGGRKLNK